MGINDVPGSPEEGEESSERAPHGSDHSVVPIIECNQQVGDHHEEERVTAMA